MVSKEATEQAGSNGDVSQFIWQVPGSNLDWNIDYPDTFIVPRSESSCLLTHSI
jgi:hypothetical protein